MEKINWSSIDKKALEAMQFIYDYCNMIDCCDECIFMDEDKDHCSIKMFECILDYKKLWEKRKKEI